VGAGRDWPSLLDEYAPVEISWERYTEKEPHPGGQEAFSIRASTFSITGREIAAKRSGAACFLVRVHAVVGVVGVIGFV